MKIYGKYLDNLTKKLKTRDITTSGDEKISIAVAQIWDSNYFTEASMIKWEKKATSDKTWANVKTYFVELYQYRTQFSHSTAGKRAKFDHANNIKEETAGIEKEENDATTMFTMMKQQYQEHINQMKERNKQALKMA